MVPLPSLAATSLENVLSLLSAVVATVTSVVIGWTAAHQRREARNAVEEVRRQTAEAAISTLDLTALGDYIYGTLGTIPIAEYASNASARGNVARALDEIERFVTEGEPI